MTIPDTHKIESECDRSISSGRSVGPGQLRTRLGARARTALLSVPHAVMNSHALTSVIIAILVSAISSASAVSQGRQTVPGHVPLVAQGLKALGPLPSTRRLSLTIGLPLRNPDSLRALLHRLYDPSDSGFRHYMSPSRFAEAYGPSNADYQVLTQFARGHQLKIGKTFPDRTLLEVSGTVADIEKAFHVRLMLYKDPRQDRTFFAPDREPSLDLETRILHITGLDDSRPPQSHPILKRSTSSTPAAGAGGGGNYAAADLRAAYAPGVAQDGSGETVGIFNPPHGLDTNDIIGYEKTAHITPLVSVEVLLVDGKSAAPDGYSTEVTLDVEMAIAMAPGLSKVIVYQGDDDLAILKRMATDDVARQLSTSWIAPPQDANADQIYWQFAAQGQSFLAAAGDDGAYYPTVPQSADDPYITVVGGTVLQTSGPGGAWVSESVWNSGGGGSMGHFTIPDWQLGLVTPLNHGLAAKRNSPDVSMIAQDVAIYYQGSTWSVAGTSIAAPLWAAYTALVNQRAAQANRPGVGFLNPSLYAVGRAGGTNALFHDVQTGDNRTPWNTQPDHNDQYFARAGFDMASGWGSPSGGALIDLLAMFGPLQSRPKLSALAASRNKDGRLELFGLSTDGAVQHAAQVVAGHLWGPWSSLAGHDLQQICASKNEDGRIEIFALGSDRQLYHIWQLSPGGDWSAWASLAGHDLKNFAVGVDGSARQSVFALGADGAVYLRSQFAPNSDFGAWTSIGGHDLGQIAVTTNSDGRLEVFALGKDSALYYVSQLVANGSWGPWSSLQGHDLKQISAAPNADGRLEVFALGGDGSVFHIWQVAPNSNWNPWSGLAGHDIREIHVAENADGRLQMIARGADGALYDLWQQTASGGWTAWSGMAGHDIQSFTSARNADGRLEVFALGADNVAYDIWQLNTGGAWSNWSSIR